jgi:hypothetical protein
MSIASHERRIAALERPTKSELDPLVLALETLNENELGLVTEFRSLINAGFLPEEIATMMAPDSCVVALDAIDKVTAELQKLEAPVRPKRKGKLLKMPKEVCHDDLSTDLSSVENDSDVSLVL